MDYFINKLKEKQPKIFSDGLKNDGIIEIIDKYVNNRTKIMVRTKYGICKSRPNDLLFGSGPTILSAINKKDYFVNKLKENQPKVFSDGPKNDAIIEIIGDYINSQKHILVKTNYGFCYAKPNTLLRGGGSSIQSAINKKQYFINKLKDKQSHIFKDGNQRDGIIEIVGNYVDNRTKIKVKTNYGFCYAKPNALLCGYGVNIEAAINKNNYWINKACKIHNNKYDYSLIKYVTCETKVRIICSIHGEFLQNSKNHLNGTGCPICKKKSIGEKGIREFLINNKILFIQEKTFDECKNKRKLRFDFYLPIQNILIEYDGKQHYKVIDYFGGKQTYEELKYNDNIKNEYAKKHKIRLIRISYVNINNINEILNNQLSKEKDNVVD